MGLRELLRDKPAAGAGIAVALILLAVGLVITRLRPSQAPSPFGQIWYFDVPSGDVFAGPNAIPPVNAPSGPESGVRAFIYACGACDPATWTIAYLETHTPEAKRIMTAPAEGPEQMAARTRAMTEGRLVAPAPDKGQAPKWIAANQAAAQQIAGTRPQCNQGQPLLCAP